MEMRALLGIAEEDIRVTFWQRTYLYFVLPEILSETEFKGEGLIYLVKGMLRKSSIKTVA
jgi:hypothetical protein